MSTEAKKRVRNDPEKGRECSHTCPERTCEGKLILRNGHEGRHESGRRPHKGCNESCPAWSQLSPEPLIKKQCIDKPAVERVFGKNSRKFRTLFIPSSDYACLLQDVTAPGGSVARIDWARTILSNEEADMVLDNHATDGFIYRDPTPEDFVPEGFQAVYIQEFLYMGIRWNRRWFSVKFMDCRSFCKLIVSGGQEVAQLADEYDWIYGGVDLSVDPRDVLDIFGKLQWVTYENHLRRLSRKVLVWPPVDESLHDARKLSVIEILDEVSNLITHTPRPKTTHVVSKADVVRLPKRGSRPPQAEAAPSVLKREASGSCKHRYLPEDVTDKVISDILKSKGCWRWMAQAYVKALQDIGEWRVFVVGGKVHSIIATSPRKPTSAPSVGQNWISSPCKSIYSLKELGDAYLPGSEADGLMHRDGGTAAERVSTLQEMQIFVEQTMVGLIEREKEYLLLNWLSVEHYCRVDISVIPDGLGNLHYFVNEVTRGHATNFFIHSDIHAANEVMDEVAEVLYIWLDGEIRP